MKFGSCKSRTLAPGTHVIRVIYVWHALTWKSFSLMENMFPFENITSSNSILLWRAVNDSVETQKPSEAPGEKFVSF